MCRIARGMLTGEHAVGRVIARPFTGTPGNFTRTEHRRDFSLPPVGTTLFDVLKDGGKEVIGIAKIEDLFAGRGLTRRDQTENIKSGKCANDGGLDHAFYGAVLSAR